MKEKVVNRKQKGLIGVIVLFLSLSLALAAGIFYIFLKQPAKPSTKYPIDNNLNLTSDTKRAAAAESSTSASIIKLLDNKIPDNPVFTAGAVAPCQPDFFDPKTSKFQKVKQGGSPSELYGIPGFLGGDGVMMIDGWSKEGENKVVLPEPFALTVYNFGCASSYSYILDLNKNNQRQALYTHVLNWSNSTDKKYLYMVNNLKGVDSKWQLLERIIDIAGNKAIKLPAIDCVNQGIWDQDKLITYSDGNKDRGDQKGPSYKTQVCIWNNGGELLYKLQGDLDWYGASKDILWSKVGFLPKDNNIFYTYKTDVETNPPQCVLYLQDLTSQNRWKKINLFTRNNPSGLIMCPHNININFTNTTFENPDIKYDNVNAD